MTIAHRTRPAGNGNNSNGSNGSNSNRPWWKEPYVWLVISGPLSVVVACGITAVYIMRGPDAVVPEENYRAGLQIRQEVQSAQPFMQPAQTGRNHSATGGRQDAQR